MSQKSSREGGALRNSSQSDESTASTTNSDLSGRTVIIRPSSSSFREKHEIKNSNDLVTYSDRGDLEAQNSKLSQKLHSLEKVSTQEVSNSLHDPYDLHHIHGLRNRLFKTFNEFSTILKNALLPPVLKSAKKVKIKIKECDLQPNNNLLDLNLLLSEIKRESKNKNLYNKKNKTNVTLRKDFQIKLIKCYKLAINATTICTKTLEAGIYNPIQSKMKNLIQIISALSLIAGKYLYGEIYKKKKKESFDLVEHCKDLEIMLEECDYKDTDKNNHSNNSNSNIINELSNKALSKPKTQLFSANSKRLSMYNHDKPKLGSNYAQAWSKKSIETTRSNDLLKKDSNIKTENNLDNIKTVIEEYPFGELNEKNYTLFFKELQDEKLINNEEIECPTTSKILKTNQLKTTSNVGLCIVKYNIWKNFPIKNLRFSSNEYMLLNITLKQAKEHYMYKKEFKQQLLNIEHNINLLSNITESIMDDLINEALLKINFNAIFNEIINNLIGMELFQVNDIEAKFNDNSTRGLPIQNN